MTPATGQLSEPVCCLEDQLSEPLFTPAEPRHDHHERAPVTRFNGKGVTPHPDQKSHQLSLFDRQALIRDAVVQRMVGAGLLDLAAKLDGCHREKFVKTCTACGKSEIVWNHCDNRLCPICQPHLAMRRRADLEWWTSAATAPKHVVLTVRNVDTITRDYVLRMKKAWGKLLRRGIASDWDGGFCAFEVTNRGNGWHFHFHAIVQSGWIDKLQLAREWADLIGQDEASVCIQSCSGDFAREAAKYVCKGSAMSAWTQIMVAEFVEAIRGVRSCWTFGTLFRRRTPEWREAIRKSREQRNRCECGCGVFIFEDAASWEWRKISMDLRPHDTHAPDHAPPDTHQLEFDAFGTN